jgi:hypothetical protein
MTDALKIGEAFQKLSKESVEATIRSYGEVSKGFQALATTVTENTKKAFEDATGTFEQLVSAKSVEQAIEIQSQYAKRAFDNYVAQASKLGEWYVTVIQNASKPVEQAVAKRTAA